MIDLENEYSKMSTKNLIRTLKDFSKMSKGDASYLTFAAYQRIEALYLRNKELEEKVEL